jgi:hypothetical protein
MSDLLNRRVLTFIGSSLTTSYQNIGSIVTISALELVIDNGTTTDIQVSDGSTNDPFYVCAGHIQTFHQTIRGSGMQQYASVLVKAQTQYQVSLPSGGTAGTGNLSITILGK